ncbi:phloem protein 2-B10 [Hibiscus trionum]|uniref:Phloem protein 2-B10 n=1 Tax=Hibiscus trionum TaxID=183268 RepID=A0A9W7LXR0_HIBTR|nr:phloem protein 2-B10 [Hibiscus trionum]
MLSSLVKHVAIPFLLLLTCSKTFWCENRFKEIPELESVCWFEIRGKISISMLSPLTHYKAYLVYKLHEDYGFEYKPVQFSVGCVGSEGSKRVAYLAPGSGRRIEQWQVEEYKQRTPINEDEDRLDEWLEAEMGEFFNEGCTDDGDLEMSALEVEGGHWKGGLHSSSTGLRSGP